MGVFEHTYLNDCIKICELIYNSVLVFVLTVQIFQLNPKPYLNIPHDQQIYKLRLDFAPAFGQSPQILPHIPPELCLKFLIDQAISGFRSHLDLRKAQSLHILTRMSLKSPIQNCH